jgi:hypothetical protein
MRLRWEDHKLKTSMGYTNLKKKAVPAEQSPEFKPQYHYPGKKKKKKVYFMFFSVLSNDLQRALKIISIVIPNLFNTRDTVVI